MRKKIVEQLVEWKIISLCCAFLGKSREITKGSNKLHSFEIKTERMITAMLGENISTCTCTADWLSISVVASIKT